MEFVSDWFIDITVSLFFSVGISEVDIIPFSFKAWEVVADRSRDIVVFGGFVIGMEIVGWFRNRFVFSIVNSESSVSFFFGNSPISVFGNTC